jgi:hypothetical protein
MSADGMYEEKIASKILNISISHSKRMLVSGMIAIAAFLVANAVSQLDFQNGCIMSLCHTVGATDNLYT